MKSVKSYVLYIEENKFIKMDTIFQNFNSENRKTSDPHILLLNL